MYLGFGLQRWIYHQRPRKIFTRVKPPLPVEDAELLTGAGPNIPELPGIIAEENIEVLKKDTRRNKVINRILLSIFAVTITGALIFLPVRLYDYFKTTNAKSVQHDKDAEKQLSDAMYRYGIYLLKEGDTTKAAAQFAESLKYNPGNRHADSALRKCFK
ncbi:MAG TPA: hypothetical protein PK796_00730 [Bacteroidales bacterium]|jgi:hypothetical protein|nr:hypothetical protein [Bacteroidales bacterium]